MSSPLEKSWCNRRDLVAGYALAVLKVADAKLMDAHLPTCNECQRDYETLAAVADALKACLAKVLPPSTPVWSRLTERIASAQKEQCPGR